MRDIEIDDTLLDLLRREKDRQEKDKPYYDKFYYYYEVDHRGKIYKRTFSSNNKQVNLVSVRRSGEFISPRTMQHTSRVIHTSLGYPEFDFHSLRHTHATMLAENGATPLYVQHRLGHKNLDVTIRTSFHYAEVSSEQGAAVIRNMYKKMIRFDNYYPLGI